MPGDGKFNYPVNKKRTKKKHGTNDSSREKY